MEGSTILVYDRQARTFVTKALKAIGAKTLSQVRAGEPYYEYWSKDRVRGEAGVVGDVTPRFVGAAPRKALMAALRELDPHEEEPIEVYFDGD